MTSQTNRRKKILAKLARMAHTVACMARWLTDLADPIFSSVN